MVLFCSECPHMEPEGPDLCAFCSHPCGGFIITNADVTPIRCPVRNGKDLEENNENR